MPPSGMYNHGVEGDMQGRLVVSLLLRHGGYLMAAHSSIQKLLLWRCVKR
jgi:hypothetical protein